MHWTDLVALLVVSPVWPFFILVGFMQQAKVKRKQEQFARLRRLAGGRRL